MTLCLCGQFIARADRRDFRDNPGRAIVKILSITAGAAGMCCGSCSRDNALAVELLARGHDVTLVPLYTPTNPDEPNVSRDRVLFGGISIYLQQSIALFPEDAALPRPPLGLAGGDRRLRQPVARPPIRSCSAI